MLNFLAETPMDSGYPNAVTLPVWNRFYRKRISAGSLSTHTVCSLEDRARVAQYTLPVIHPPARRVYNRERILSDTGAVFQRANRVRRQRTSGDSLPVESIPDRERNRIRVTRIHRRLGQKVQHKRRGRSKSAHVRRGAIAVGGLAASRE